MRFTQKTILLVTLMFSFTQAINQGALPAIIFEHVCPFSNDKNRENIRHSKLQAFLPYNVLKKKGVVFSAILISSHTIRGVHESDDATLCSGK